MAHKQRGNRAEATLGNKSAALYLPN